MEDLLLIPGPTPVPSSVRAASARPLVNHRSAAFARVLREVLEGMRWVYRTSAPVLPYASSGTGVLEAAVVNTLSPGDSVLALVCGAFGDRFARIAEVYGARVIRVEVEWGSAVPPDLVAEQLRRNPDVRAVLVTHNETSTGIANDLKAIARARGDHPALLLVDAVSSLGAVPLEMDAWGLDVVVAASQKALGCPPGVGFAAASDRAWEAHRAARMPRFYWDFTLLLTSLEQEIPETPFTPAISIFYALQEGLRLLREEGLEASFARHRRLARAVRAGVEALGLRPVGDSAHASSAVTAVWAPEGTSVRALVDAMYERHRIVLAGGQGKLSGRVFRIGHLGHVRPEDILRCMEALEDVLTLLGVPVARGSGVRAAEEALQEVTV
ncbi:MAG: alanine--glyoxylate aminotransferase family protein [Armatimonadetes bacterium]|nr:alanine--glyoxylate aminotransferase family protein [Armatimonadota bacterium]MDW8154006.1 alanine--glyoxylate aminotransferase family protein [Armatimonadota bacterium]